MSAAAHLELSPRTASASSPRSPGQSTWRPPPLKTPARRAASAELTTPSRPRRPRWPAMAMAAVTRPGRPFAVGCSPNRYALMPWVCWTTRSASISTSSAHGRRSTEIERMETGGRSAPFGVSRRSGSATLRRTVEEVAPHRFSGIRVRRGAPDRTRGAAGAGLPRLRRTPHPRRAWASSRACRAGPGLRARSAEHLEPRRRRLSSPSAGSCAVTGPPSPAASPDPGFYEEPPTEYHDVLEDPHPLAHDEVGLNTETSPPPHLQFEQPPKRPRFARAAAQSPRRASTPRRRPSRRMWRRHRHPRFHEPTVPQPTAGRRLGSDGAGERTAPEPQHGTRLRTPPRNTSTSTSTRQSSLNPRRRRSSTSRSTSQSPFRLEATGRGRARRDAGVPPGHARARPALVRAAPAEGLRLRRLSRYACCYRR